jgi:hypothetical protein
MKKLIIFTITLLAVFACFQSSFAKSYYRTFEVAEIQSDGIVLKDFDGATFLLNKDPKKIKGGLKVGDTVRYDTVRDRLKKSPWQPAKVTKMTDNNITLQLNSGEQIDVSMQSKYKEKIKKGDQVYFKASSKQIKKSNLKKLDEE